MFRPRTLKCKAFNLTRNREQLPHQLLAWPRAPTPRLSSERARLQNPQQTSLFHFCQVCSINIVPFSAENQSGRHAWPTPLFHVSVCICVFFRSHLYLHLLPLDLRLVVAVIPFYLLLHPHNHLPIWVPEVIVSDRTCITAFRSAVLWRGI